MDVFKLELAAQVLAGLALVAVLKLGLLSALLSGLLIYELVHLVALKLNWVGVTHEVGKAVALILLASLIAVATSIGGIGLLALLTGGSEGLVVLLQTTAVPTSNASSSGMPNPSYSEKTTSATARS